MHCNLCIRHVAYNDDGNIKIFNFSLKARKNGSLTTINSTYVFENKTFKLENSSRVLYLEENDRIVVSMNFSPERIDTVGDFYSRINVGSISK